MSARFERVAVVGVGLIGGSLALDLKAGGLAGAVVGVDTDPDNLELARELEVVDEVADLGEACASADLVVVAVPPARTAGVVLDAARASRPGTLVTDVASVKGPIVAGVGGALPEGVRFVPGHPVAGTEKSGAAAAMRNLFRGRRCILTPVDGTDGGALAAVRALWEGVGADVLEMPPDLHDLVCASISHLPHAAVYALTAAVGSFAERRPEIVGLGAGGFVDTTRIASSDPGMWSDIFALNRTHVLDALDGFLAQLGEMRALVADGDPERIRRYLERSRAVRARVLREG